MALTSALVAGFAIWLWPLSGSTSPFWLVLFLTAMVTLAGRFPIELSKQADASLRVVPIFMAILLLHPAEAMIVAAVGTLASELLLKAPVRAWVFNIGVDTLAAGLAGLVFFSLRPEGSVIAMTAGQILPAGAAGLTLLIVNIALVDIMAIVRQGWEFINHWKFNYYLLETPQEAGFMIVGLIGGLLTAQAWWGPVLVAVPAMLTYFGFKFVVSEAAEKTRLAEELQDNIKELQEMQAHLINTAKLASVGTLATGIAHEINNPVFAISGRADLLISGASKHLASDKAIEYVKNIKEMSIRIAAITGSLMEYAQSDEDKNEVYLNEIMDSAANLMGKKTKSLRVIREYEDNPLVDGVQAQLQQVFVNLLTNAAEALPDWGTVTMGCRIEDNMAVAYVKDDGIGISNEVMEHLFEPFNGSKDVNNRVGLGIGLYTSRNIVTAHDGEISVESETGKGTTFTVKLPLAEIADVDFDPNNMNEPDMPMAIGLQD